MDSENFYKKQLGKILRRDEVKLWEPPFTHKDGEIGDFPNDIVSKYASELGISNDEVKSLLENLRAHSLQKLAEKKEFQRSRKATLKIKFAGNNSKQRKIISLEIDLTSLGRELKMMVADSLSQSPDNLKMISNGKVINENFVLHEQNVKNCNQIMVLCLNQSGAAANAEEKVISELQETRETAEYLSKKAEQGHDVPGLDLQITDQKGKPVQLPPEEKRALTLAMTLHEKGRQALKKKNISLALPLLLEADEEFSQCSSTLLDVVDNYAILCLDIVWCYLCLKNIEDLPDAAERLQKSETIFHKSYGTNLERLMTVKGSTGEEVALFMRLHLLQGIVAFHQNELDSAQKLLSEAEQELKRLQVDKEKIASGGVHWLHNQLVNSADPDETGAVSSGSSLFTVISMGFTDAEARLGLRACDGIVTNAIARIIQRKEEKVENEKKLQEDRRREQLQHSLGKTAHGHRVNTDLYDQLVSMGYGKGAAAESLRQSNNDLNLALQVIQNHPEFLDLPDPEPKPKVNITDGMIAKVTSMGFEPEMARRALLKHFGDISKSVEELIQSGENVPPPEESPGTSSGSSASSPTEEKSEEELQRDKERVKKLVSDMPVDEEDYLDIQLDEETEFLNQYMSLINSLRH